MASSKTLPLPLPGSNIHYNPASLQVLKSTQHGVRIRFNSRGDHWQMLNSPQYGGPVGGLLVILENPEALDDAKKPNVAVITRVLPGGTCAYAELKYNPDFPDAKPFTPSVAGSRTAGSMSPDALLQAAYDRKQKAGKHSQATGGRAILGQQVRGQPGVGRPRQAHKKPAARAS